MTTSRKSGARLGMVGYTTILRRLQRKAMTTAEVCAVQAGCMNSMRFLMRRMHHCGLIHIEGWQARTVRSGGFAAQWRAGDLPDAPYPGPLPKRVARPENNVASEMVAFASLIRELREPTTKADLAQATGLNEESIRAVLDHAHDINFVRIGGWQRHGHDGFHAAMWVLGQGPDVRRPEPKPRADVNRDSNRRRRELAAVKRVQAVVTALPFAQCLEAA